MAKLRYYMPVLLVLVAVTSFLSTLSLCQTTNSTGKENEDFRCKAETSSCCGIEATSGRVGIPGHSGLRGPNGPPGRSGLDGIAGTKGYPGEQGARGPRGWRGSPGAPGTRGVNGVPGRKGDDGPRGTRGLIGSPGLAGTNGQKGEPGHQGETGGFSNLWVCNCEWNDPTQVFHVTTTVWIHDNPTTEFCDVPAAFGEFHVKSRAPVTYVLHVGGDQVIGDATSVFYRVRCSYQDRVEYIPYRTGHRIFKYEEWNRLESETFTGVEDSMKTYGIWRCQLQIRKEKRTARYRWDSNYGELSLTMW